MQRNESANRTAPFRQVMKYFSLAMAVVYVGAGVALIAGQWETPRIDRQYAVLLGLALCVYGFFRAARHFQKYKGHQDE